MESLLAIAHTAILALRQGVHWKPGKAEPHLQKRIRRGHLPQGATQADYDAIIQAVAHEPTATVYVYTFTTMLYPTFVTDVGTRRWLVMTDENGILETAFPPDDTVTYLANPQFTYLGTIKEVLS